MLKQAAKKVLGLAGLRLLRESYLPVGYDLYRDLRNYSRSKHFSVVVDAGANIGQTAHEYVRRFPDATIHSIEPTPDLFAKLVHGVKPFPQVHCYRLALGESSGTGRLNVYDDAGLVNSLEKHPTHVPSQSISVPILTLDEFARSNGIGHINLLKLDLEGGELATLKGARQLLAGGGIEFILSEFTAWGEEPISALQTRTSLNELVNELTPHHFRIIAVYTDYILPEQEYLFVRNVLFLNTHF